MNSIFLNGDQTELNMGDANAEGNDRLTVSVAAHIGRIVINRPEKRNALDRAMWRALAAAVAALNGNGDVRVAVISGAGDDFSAGADIDEFDTVRGNAETARDYEALNSAAFAAIRHSAIPTIAAIRGMCLGGGFGIAAACDLRVATDDAQFAVPAARLGLAYPHDAMEDIVHSCGPQFARFLTFSGARISAAEARRLGFLMRVVPGQEFDTEIDALAKQIAAAAPLSVRASKLAIRSVISSRAEDADAARNLGAATFDSSDYEEGRRAFRERRTPVFHGR